MAAGYLQDYTTIYSAQRGGLWGHFFGRELGRHELGFFAGFLTRRQPRSGEWGSLFQFEPPECAVFAFVRPAGAKLHRHLVRVEPSPLRRAYELLTKYTTRRPRFEFHEDHWAPLIRHVPLAAFPAPEREKYARNFFMETLALLVRTRLPEDFLQARFPSP